MFRQESDWYEIWYSDDDNPEMEPQMIVVNKSMTIRELCWWLRTIREEYTYGTKIDIIREHF